MPGSPSTVVIRRARQLVERLGPIVVDAIQPCNADRKLFRRPIRNPRQLCVVRKAASKRNGSVRQYSLPKPWPLPAFPENATMCSVSKAVLLSVACTTGSGAHAMTIDQSWRAVGMRGYRECKDGTPRHASNRPQLSPMRLDD